MKSGVRGCLSHRCPFHPTVMFHLAPVFDRTAMIDRAVVVHHDVTLNSPAGRCFSFRVSYVVCLDEQVGMVGDAQVGKTTLMVKYVENKFDEEYIMTLGELKHDSTRCLCSLPSRFVFGRVMPGFVALT